MCIRTWHNGNRKEQVRDTAFFFNSFIKEMFFFFLTLISSWTSLKKAKQKVQKTSSFF